MAKAGNSKPAVEQPAIRTAALEKLNDLLEAYAAAVLGCAYSASGLRCEHCPDRPEACEPDWIAFTANQLEAAELLVVGQGAGDSAGAAQSWRLAIDVGEEFLQDYEPFRFHWVSASEGKSGCSNWDGPAPGDAVLQQVLVKTVDDLPDCMLGRIVTRLMELQSELSAYLPMRVPGVYKGLTRAPLVVQHIRPDLCPYSSGLAEQLKDHYERWNGVLSQATAEAQAEEADPLGGVRFEYRISVIGDVDSYELLVDGEPVGDLDGTEVQLALKYLLSREKSIFASLRDFENYVKESEFESSPRVSVNVSRAFDNIVAALDVSHELGGRWLSRKRGSVGWARGCRPKRAHDTLRDNPKE